MVRIFSADWFKIRMNVFQDWTKILGSQYVLLIILALPSFLFLMTDQGLDVIYCVLEDLVVMDLATSLWLFFGLFFWSISTRFCSRFITYLNDNSGAALAPHEVTQRVMRQTRIGNFFGMLPILIAFGSFLRVGIKNVFIKGWLKQEDEHLIQTIALSIILIAIVLIGWFCWWLYYQNGIRKLFGRNRRLRWLLLTHLERIWSAKLYGIFNDIRFQMTKATADAEGINIKSDLPAGKLLPDGRVLPPIQRSLKAASENALNAEPEPLLPKFRLRKGYPCPEKKSELIIWMYRAPRSFYKRLRMQFRILFLLSLSIIIFFAFCLKLSMFEKCGTVALVFIAAGCWQAVYTAAHYADKVKYRWKIPVPVRSTLFLLFIITTYFNHDHPVRTVDNSPLIADTRKQLPDHFKSWLTLLSQQDTIRVDTGKRIPVIFITSEGGALRTGGFTTMLLARMSEYDTNFNRHIYAYSSVSGGSIGCNVFYALTKLKNNDTAVHADLSKLAEEFYKTDFLPPP